VILNQKRLNLKVVGIPWLQGIDITSLHSIYIHILNLDTAQPQKALQDISGIYLDEKLFEIFQEKKIAFTVRSQNLNNYQDLISALRQSTTSNNINTRTILVALWIGIQNKNLSNVEIPVSYVMENVSESMSPYEIYDAITERLEEL